MNTINFFGDCLGCRTKSTKNNQKLTISVIMVIMADFANAGLLTNI